MPDEKTHADSLRTFLTGASTHAGAQADPNASLGLHQSSTEALPVSWTVVSAISGITIEKLSGANGIGACTLTASGASELKWTPQGGTIGAGVTIANGETKIVEGGAGELEKFIRVTRTSATALSGTATVTTAETYNNVVGYDDVSSAEQSAGDTEYRCLCIKNVSANNVKSITVQLVPLGTQRTTDTTQLGASGSGTIVTTGSFADWPNSGYGLIKDSGGTEREIIYYTSRTDTTLTVPAAGRGLRGFSASAGAATDTIDAIPSIDLALDAPTSQPSGTFEDETATGEGTDPGLTFESPVGDTDALLIGDLAANEIYAVWLRREIPAGATADSSSVNRLRFKYDAA